VGMQIIMACRRWIGMESCSPHVTREKVLAGIFLEMVWAFDIMFFYSFVYCDACGFFILLPILLSFFVFSSVCLVGLACLVCSLV